MGNNCQNSKEIKPENLNFRTPTKAENVLVMRGNLSDVSVSNYSYDYRSKHLTALQKNNVKKAN